MGEHGLRPRSDELTAPDVIRRPAVPHASCPSTGPRSPGQAVETMRIPSFMRCLRFEEGACSDGRSGAVEQLERGREGLYALDRARGEPQLNVAEAFARVGAQRLGDLLGRRGPRPRILLRGSMPALVLRPGEGHN